MFWDVHGSMLYVCAGAGGGSCHPDGIRHYVAAGKAVPERLLPGRYLMQMMPAAREQLARTNFMNVAPWWIELTCASRAQNLLTVEAIAEFDKRLSRSRKNR